MLIVKSVQRLASTFMKTVSDPFISQDVRYVYVNVVYNLFHDEPFILSSL
jgi:hypothetical protein